MELRIDWRYWWWSRHGFTRLHAPILYETISHPLTDNSTLYLLNRSRIPENISAVEIVPHGGPKSLASPNNIRHNQLWKHMNFLERALQCDRYVVAMIDKRSHDTAMLQMCIWAWIFKWIWLTNWKLEICVQSATCQRISIYSIQMQKLWNSLLCHFFTHPTSKHLNHCLFPLVKVRILLQFD